MGLQSLTLTRFRNYEHLEFIFPPGVLVLIGDNGSGKTNFLEALSFVGTTRSFRTKRHYDVVQWGEDSGAISLTLAKDDPVSHLGIFFDRTKKTRQFRCERTAVSVLDFLGKFPVVFFAPDDTLMVTGSPKLRRQFLDIALSQCDGEYFRSVTEYQRIVRHRNTLLCGIRDRVSSVDELSFWDAQLCSLGADIMQARLQLLFDIHVTLSEYYSRLADGAAHCFLEYKPSFSFDHDQQVSRDDIEQALTTRLLQDRDREIRYGRTLLGPHLDDVRFYLDDRPLADFGSRGEIRSMLLSLRLAQKDVFAERLSHQPVLLFDDVFSELDRGRRERLLQAVSSTQTVFTTTDVDGVDYLASDSAVVSVRDGILTQNN